MLQQVQPVDTIKDVLTWAVAHPSGICCLAADSLFFCPSQKGRVPACIKRLVSKNHPVTSTVCTLEQFLLPLAAKWRLRRTHKRHGCGKTHYHKIQSVTSPACGFFPRVAAADFVSQVVTTSGMVPAKSPKML